MSVTSPAQYQKMLDEVFHSIGNAIGIHVLLLVLEHALWQTKQQHEKASLIRFSEEGISLEQLDQLNPEDAGEIVRDFILAIIGTLGRLVGKQLANQLVDTLQLHITNTEES